MSVFGTCPHCGGTTMDYHCGPCLAEENERLHARVGELETQLAATTTPPLREFNLAAVPLSSSETAAAWPPPLCPMCGYVPTTAAGVMCVDCTQRSARDDHQLTQLMNSGHTYHCAARQTWGDGSCECGVGPHGPRVPGGL